MLHLFHVIGHSSCETPRIGSLPPLALCRFVFTQRLVQEFSLAAIISFEKSGFPPLADGGVGDPKLLCNLVSGQLTCFSQPLVPAFETIALIDVDDRHTCKPATFARA